MLLINLKPFFCVSNYYILPLASEPTWTLITNNNILHNQVKMGLQYIAVQQKLLNITLVHEHL